MVDSLYKEKNDDDDVLLCFSNNKQFSLKTQLECDINYRTIRHDPHQMNDFLGVSWSFQGYETYLNLTRLWSFSTTTEF